MTTLFRLDASIRTDGSVTRAVADTLEASVVEELGEVSVVRRDIGLQPLPSDAWAASVTAGFVPETDWTPAQREARALAAQVADEIVGADAYVFAVPFYNFGVAASFKQWFDLAITDPRLAPGVEAPVKGRPAFLVIARGGGYGEGTPRHGWDHATAWLRRVLVDVWGLDLDVIETELTLAEVTPAMAELRDLARRQLAESHETARSVGRSVTLKLGAAA